MGIRDERGAALVLALQTVVVVMALGAALALITSSEIAIASNFRAGSEAFYAADGAFERALVDLRATADWDSVVAGTSRSTFVDGGPTGIRRLADSSTIDVAAVVNMANCQKATTCTDAELDAQTSERPWGLNNPRWVAYAYGPLADGAGSGSILSAFYVVVLVGDDPSENDADPAHDGRSVGAVTNPGRGVVTLRAEAFGPRNAHRSIEATVAQDRAPGGGAAAGGGAELRVLAWREAN